MKNITDSSISLSLLGGHCVLQGPFIVGGQVETCSQSEKVLYS